MSDTDEKARRLAELEQEAARLRAELDTGAGEADQRDLQPHLPSRSRAIVAAIVIGIGALCAIIGIIYAMSSVIEPFSKKAAGALAPFSAPAAERPATRRSRPDPSVKFKTAPEDPGLRAPGL